MSTSPSEPSWLSQDDVLEIQREQIELFGGAHGVRDMGLLESAIARPKMLFYWDGEEDILALAIRLGLGIAQNHPFVDGNKRTGVAALIEFLTINGYWLDMPNDTRLGRLFKVTVAKRRQEADLYADLYPCVVPWGE